MSLFHQNNFYFFTPTHPTILPFLLLIFYFTTFLTSSSVVVASQNVEIQRALPIVVKPDNVMASLNLDVDLTSPPALDVHLDPSLEKEVKVIKKNKPQAVVQRIEPIYTTPTITTITTHNQKAYVKEERFNDDDDTQQNRRRLLRSQPQQAKHHQKSSRTLSFASMIRRKKENSNREETRVKSQQKRVVAIHPPPSSSSSSKSENGKIKSKYNDYLYSQLKRKSGPQNKINYLYSQLKRKSGPKNKIYRHPNVQNKGRQTPPSSPSNYRSIKQTKTKSTTTIPTAKLQNSKIKENPFFFWFFLILGSGVGMTGFFIWYDKESFTSILSHLKTFSFFTVNSPTSKSKSHTRGGGNHHHVCLTHTLLIRSRRWWKERIRASRIRRQVQQRQSQNQNLNPSLSSSISANAPTYLTTQDLMINSSNPKGLSTDQGPILMNTNENSSYTLATSHSWFLFTYLIHFQRYFLQILNSIKSTCLDYYYHSHYYSTFGHENENGRGLEEDDHPVPPSTMNKNSIVTEVRSNGRTGSHHETINTTKKTNSNSSTSMPSNKTSSTLRRANSRHNSNGLTSKNSLKKNKRNNSGMNNSNNSALLSLNSEGKRVIVNTITPSPSTSTHLTSLSNTLVTPTSKKIPLEEVTMNELCPKPTLTPVTVKTSKSNDLDEKKTSVKQEKVKAKIDLDERKENRKGGKKAIKDLEDEKSWVNHLDLNPNVHVQPINPTTSSSKTEMDIKSILKNNKSKAKENVTPKKAQTVEQNEKDKSKSNTNRTTTSTIQTMKIKKVVKSYSEILSSTSPSEKTKTETIGAKTIDKKQPTHQKSLSFSIPENSEGQNRKEEKVKEQTTIKSHPQKPKEGIKNKIVTKETIVVKKRRGHSLSLSSIDTATIMALPPLVPKMTPSPLHVIKAELMTTTTTTHNKMMPSTKPTIMKSEISTNMNLVFMEEPKSTEEEEMTYSEKLISVVKKSNNVNKTRRRSTSLSTLPPSSLLSSKMKKKEMESQTTKMKNEIANLFSDMKKKNTLSSSMKKEIELPSHSNSKENHVIEANPAKIIKSSTTDQNGRRRSYADVLNNVSNDRTLISADSKNMNEKIQVDMKNDLSSMKEKRNRNRVKTDNTTSDVMMTTLTTMIKDGPVSSEEKVHEESISQLQTDKSEDVETTSHSIIEHDVVELVDTEEDGVSEQKEETEELNSNDEMDENDENDLNQCKSLQNNTKSKNNKGGNTNDNDNGNSNKRNGNKKNNNNMGKRNADGNKGNSNSNNNSSSNGSGDDHPNGNNGNNNNNNGNGNNNGNNNNNNKGKNGGKNKKNKSKAKANNENNGGEEEKPNPTNPTTPSPSSKKKKGKKNGPKLTIDTTNKTNNEEVETALKSPNGTTATPATNSKKKNKKKEAKEKAVVVTLTEEEEKALEELYSKAGPVNEPVPTDTEAENIIYSGAYWSPKIRNERIKSSPFYDETRMSKYKLRYAYHAMDMLEYDPETENGDKEGKPTSSAIQANPNHGINYDLDLDQIMDSVIRKEKKKTEKEEENEKKEVLNENETNNHIKEKEIIDVGNEVNEKKEKSLEKPVNTTINEKVEKNKKKKKRNGQSDTQTNSLPSSDSMVDSSLNTNEMDKSTKITSSEKKKKGTVASHEGEGKEAKPVNSTGDSLPEKEKQLSNKKKKKAKQQASQKTQALSQSSTLNEVTQKLLNDTIEKDEEDKQNLLEIENNGTPTKKSTPTSNKKKKAGKAKNKMVVDNNANGPNTGNTIGGNEENNTVVVETNVNGKPKKNKKNKKAKKTNGIDSEEGAKKENINPNLPTNNNNSHNNSNNSNKKNNTTDGTIGQGKSKKKNNPRVKINVSNADEPNLLNIKNMETNSFTSPSTTIQSFNNLNSTNFNLNSLSRNQQVSGSNINSISSHSNFFDDTNLNLYKNVTSTTSTSTTPTTPLNKTNFNLMQNSPNPFTQDNVLTNDSYLSPHLSPISYPNIKMNLNDHDYDMFNDNISYSPTMTSTFNTNIANAANYVNLVEPETGKTVRRPRSISFNSHFLQRQQQTESLDSDILFDQPDSPTSYLFKNKLKNAVASANYMTGINDSINVSKETYNNIKLPITQPTSLSPLSLAPATQAIKGASIFRPISPSSSSKDYNKITASHSPIQSPIQSPLKSPIISMKNLSMTSLDQENNSSHYKEEMNSVGNIGDNNSTGNKNGRSTTSSTAKSMKDIKNKVNHMNGSTDFLDQEAEENLTAKEFSLFGSIANQNNNSRRRRARTISSPSMPQTIERKGHFYSPFMTGLDIKYEFYIPKMTTFSPLSSSFTAADTYTNYNNSSTNEDINNNNHHMGIENDHDDEMEDFIEYSKRKTSVSSNSSHRTRSKSLNALNNPFNSFSSLDILNNDLDFNE